MLGILERRRLIVIYGFQIALMTHAGNLYLGSVNSKLRTVADDFLEVHGGRI